VNGIVVADKKILYLQKIHAVLSNIKKFKGFKESDNNLKKL